MALTRRSYRANAWLTVVLAAALFALADRLAHERLHVSRDVSEDRLVAMAPETRALLAELQDVLAVRAYFTGDVRHGPVAIAKDRLVHQLRELEDRASGRLRLTFADPGASSEARLEAARLGIEPVAFQAVRGTSAVAQEVFLGLVLRYRGRERTLAFVLPQTLEYAFVAELASLLRERPLVVGVLAPDASQEPERMPAVPEARRLLALSYTVRDVEGLAGGREVPGDVDVLLAVRPVRLHSRAAFAIEAHLRRGGAALLALDHALVDSAGGAVASVESGLEPLLDAWGVPLRRGHVWDQAKSHSVRSRAPGSGSSAVAIAYPYWVRVDAEGLAREVPATARLAGADLFWAHALGEGPAPAGLERVDLAWSSERSWLVPEVETTSFSPEALNAQAAELLGAREGAPLVLAATVSGRFPTAFQGGAPPARDVLGRAPPSSAGSARAAPQPAAETGRAVVVGDSDWLLDGETFTERNRMLLTNLVAWLGLAEGYRALPARFPRERPLRDFVAAERERLGVPIVEGTLSWERAEELSRAERLAQARAARRRWTAMGLASAGSLAAVAVLVVLARALLARGVRLGAP